MPHYYDAWAGDYILRTKAAPVAPPLTAVAAGKCVAGRSNNPRYFGDLVLTNGCGVFMTVECRWVNRNLERYSGPTTPQGMRNASPQRRRCAATIFLPCAPSGSPFAVVHGSCQCSTAPSAFGAFPARSATPHCAVAFWCLTRRHCDPALRRRPSRAGVCTTCRSRCLIPLLPARSSSPVRGLSPGRSRTLSTDAGVLARTSLAAGSLLLPLGDISRHMYLRTEIKDQGEKVAQVGDTAPLTLFVT